MICPFCEQEADEDEYVEVEYFGRIAIFFKGKHAPFQCKPTEKYLLEAMEHIKKFGEVAESG